MKELRYKLVKKLNNKKGESLVEVLLTILLVGLVSAGFLVVVETAHSIQAKVVEIDQNFYNEVSEAEAGKIDADSETRKLTFTNIIGGDTELSTTTIDISVKTIEGEHGILSYRLDR